MTIFITDRIVVLDGVNNVFKGIIRGQNMMHNTYYYNDEKELESFALDHWLYVKRPSNNDDLALLMDNIYSKMDNIAKDKFTSNLSSTVSFKALTGDVDQNLTHQDIAISMVDAYEFSAAVHANIAKRGVI